MALGRTSPSSEHEAGVYSNNSIYMAMETQIARTKGLIYRADAEVFEMANSKSSGHATPNDEALMNYFNQHMQFREYRSLLARNEFPYKNIFIPGKRRCREIENGRTWALLDKFQQEMF